MSHSYPCSYEWDTIRFPAPRLLLQELEQQHIKTNVWVNPYLLPGSTLGGKIEPYTSSHTVWCGLVPDYMLQDAQGIMVKHFEDNQVDIGVSGYKIDENDGYDFWLWPDVAIFPSGTPAELIRQIYGSLLQSMTTKMYRKRNQRTYGMVRAANAGTSSFPYVLYSDYYNHKDYITALINSSFIGVLWTPEVRGAKTASEWLRRMQTVCFSPLAILNAWADGTKPWSFPEVADQIYELARLRMQLIPYLYTAFANYAFKGIPPIRAMYLEDGYQEKIKMLQGKLDAVLNPYAMAIKKEVRDQYMLGEYILVAPMFADEVERDVVLPLGKWYDFYTGEFVGGGEVISVKQKMGRVPLYVKDGGIIPLWPAISELDMSHKYPLEIRHYGEKSSEYNLYDDDGETYNYEQGDYTWITLKIVVNDLGDKFGTVVLPEGNKIWSFSEYKFRFMTNE